MGNLHSLIKTKYTVITSHKAFLKHGIETESNNE